MSQRSFLPNFNQHPQSSFLSLVKSHCHYHYLHSSNPIYPITHILSIPKRYQHLIILLLMLTSYSYLAYPKQLYHQNNIPFNWHLLHCLVFATSKQNINHTTIQLDTYLSHIKTISIWPIPPVCWHVSPLQGRIPIVDTLSLSFTHKRVPGRSHCCLLMAQQAAMLFVVIFALW